ncbi:hypothetical protein [Deinococcus yavapaiensis]|uniref:Uncharacterized protein n=1 Tax=Deinococcus yavapaiensis KR-236 TaxID=694435 RepID=A0A318S6T5_9DEIO|nr:hypothetical protein [Deinococcus yavapaiensis]PYE52759.1 hypothetical protein DES52_11280 [Deinococcus yavapaiensis KR-236]
MKRLTFSLSTAALLVGITLASGATAANPPLPPITRVGVVSIGRSSMQMPGVGSMDVVTSNASFYRGGGESLGSAARDVCTVLASVPDAQEPSTPGLDTPEKAPNVVSLDAGNPLVLRGAAQSYANLPRFKQGATISYAANPPLRQAPPANLVIDIPGAQGGFPAMKNMAFPTTAPVTLSAPKNGVGVKPSTTFTWSNPTKDANTLVLLSGTQEEGGVTFTCTAIDDGTFTFPAATAAALKKAGFEVGQLTMLGRMSSRSYRQGDAQLVLQVTSMQTFMPQDEGDE